MFIEIGVNDLVGMPAMSCVGTWGWALETGGSLRRQDRPPG
jgi:hypothetical protein